MKSRILPFFMTLLLILSACSKDIGLATSYNDQMKTILKADQTMTANNISNSDIEVPEGNLPFNGPDLDLTSITTEQEAESALAPIIYNAENQYNSVITQLTQTSEWANLSISDKDEILNMGTQQKVLLSIIIEANRDEVDWNRLKHCGLAALGFHRAQTLLINAFKTGMSATTAIQALKFIGQRYLGYIALAFAIYEFTSCIIDDNPDEEYPLIGEKQNIFIIPERDPGFCGDINDPNIWSNFQTKYFSLSTLGNIDQNSFNSTPSITIYLHPTNNLLYLDSTYGEVIPDGYYSINCGNTTYQEFVEVINGLTTQVCGKYL